MKLITEERLKPRRQPRQDRSIIRAQQILDVTAKLLDRVGFDDLTTILITKELGISVGSLYHYFPNKHAILRSLAEQWLEEWDKTLDEISLFTVEQIDLLSIVEDLTESYLVLYRQQQGILPLVQAMYAVPELRDLDEQHDKRVIKCMSALFKRMGMQQSKVEINRIAQIYLEIMHTILVIVLNQRGLKAQQTLRDLNEIIVGLLQRHLTF